MSTVLTTFGVGEDAERLYRRVLRVDALSPHEHGFALGWNEPQVEAALTPLVATGLVRQDLDGRLVADHPRRSIARLVDRESARLDLRRRELEDVRASVGDFSADHLAGRADLLDPTAIDVVPATMLPGVVEEAMRTTTGEIRQFRMAVASGAATDDGVWRQTRAVLVAGRSMRSIYPVAVLDDPQHLDWVREWASFGERQRVADVVPHEFVVFGDQLVISSPQWGQPATSAVLLRMPLLVAAFTAVFEDAWSGALAVPDELIGQDAETRLLTLLATGFKDEAIARYLGVGVRTVRRRVAEVMEQLNVHTRYQLGVVAERRGMLGRRG
jgi:DNA-binding CsgD family transcriptional regulator